ncbi:MAG: phytanoyl-CoA dioxygenase family protein [Candidatus Hydrogenedentes bacterium]|nr:phytanoyl-CoA dioxygenase family protein [Candidatus Hydrogenedentota bacterium]
MKLHMGKVALELGSKYLSTLREANDLLDDVAALRARMEEDGYLLIRGLHDRNEVMAGRRRLLEALAEEGQLDSGADLMEGVLKPGARGAFYGGKKAVTHGEEVLRVLEGDRVMNFFSRFLGGPARTFDYKWIRLVAKDQFTGAHYDVVYMGRGTTNLYTCWTPFGDVGLEHGPLAICVGSHQFERVKLTYGQMDVDRDHVHGWFSSDPIEIVDKFGGLWATGSFSMGDALIFSMYTLHGSFNNTTDRVRISADTRYQLASEPIDERWIGEKPTAHYGWNDPAKNVSMEEARAKWNV